MAGARKPRPDLVDRATVEAMIAQAVAAERERSEKAMAAAMLAIGALADRQAVLKDASVEICQKLDAVGGLVGPMAEAFAAGMDLMEAAERAADPSPVN